MSSLQFVQRAQQGRDEHPERGITNDEQTSTLAHEDIETRLRVGVVEMIDQHTVLRAFARGKERDLNARRLRMELEK